MACHTATKPEQMTACASPYFHITIRRSDLGMAAPGIWVKIRARDTESNVVVGQKPSSHLADIAVAR